MSNIYPIEVVFSVVDPKYPASINFEKIAQNEILLKSALKLAERNGLYYNFMLKLKELHVNLIPLDEEKRWERELKDLDGLKKTIELLNQTVDESEVEYILIKACTKIPHVPRDVDIYINPEKQQRFVKALEKNGMNCIHSDDVDTSLTKKNYTKVDIYTGLCYFTVEFIDGDFLWDLTNKDFMFGINYPGLKPEANFIIMLVHSLFGHSSMSLLDFLHMTSLLDEMDDINICKKYAYNKGWGKAFDLAMAELDTVRDKIYENGETVDFPYLFNRKFVFTCINEIEGLEMTNITKTFLYISLIQDQAVFILKDTPLYNMLRSFNFTRNLINSIGYFIRNMRGDKRSVSSKNGNKS